jgi:hypothetical protein
LVLKSTEPGTTQETTELTEPVFAPESQPPTPRSNQPGRRRKT